MAIQIREQDTFNDDYQVGYGRPPKEHQYKKGKSGNPSGKIKLDLSGMNSLQRAIVKELRSKVRVKGTGRKVSVVEATANRIISNLMQGRPIDQLRSLKLLSELGVFDALERAEEERSRARANSKFDHDMRRLDDIGQMLEEVGQFCVDATPADYAWDPYDDAIEMDPEDLRWSRDLGPARVARYGPHRARTYGRDQQSLHRVIVQRYAPRGQQLATSSDCRSFDLQVGRFDQMSPCPGRPGAGRENPKQSNRSRRKLGPGGMRACPAGNGKGACACGYRQVSQHPASAVAPFTTGGGPSGHRR